MWIAVELVPVEAGTGMTENFQSLTPLFDMMK